MNRRQTSAADEYSIAARLSQRRRARRRAGLTLSMTAMIDVVFLLLIYFMVATDFRMGEGVFRIDLPSREGAGQRDPFQLDDEPLRISVASTGVGATMYRLTVSGPFPQPRTFEELHDFLNNYQVNEATIAAGRGGLFQPNHPIIIQPTRFTRWEHAIECFNAAARARYTNITFAKPN